MSRGLMTAPSSSVSRYHALDALRAAMMFLGIYLHAAVAYSPIGGWPIKPQQLTSVFDYSIVWIHVFRMPVFYVMAGFFAALLWERYGVRRTAANRFWRIVVPFVVGWIIIYPITMFLTVYFRSDFQQSWDFIRSGRFLAHAHPLHLWFLEYLIVLYALAGVAVAAVRFLMPDRLKSLLVRSFRSAVQSVWAPLPFAVLSFLALLPMKYAGLDDPPSFVPAIHIVVAYALPFAFGWMLFASADLLEILRRRAWLYIAVGGAASIVYLTVLFSTVDRGWPFYATRFANALAMWGLILGVTGLFLRYLSGHSAFRRYLCDSSYFLYIAHFPVILAFQVILKDVPLSPVAKMPLVLIGTVAVLLPLYRYAVRPTFVGAVLNGRRYPGELVPAVAAS